MAWVQDPTPVLPSSDWLDWSWAFTTSLDGQVLFAPQNYTGTYTNQGRVIVYDKVLGGWNQRGFITIERHDDAFFGELVACNSDGTTVCVGMHRYTMAPDYLGAVYTFDWTGSSWVQRGSPLLASNASYLEEFGSSGLALSADGSVLAVGAKEYYGTVTGQGCVRTYDRGGDNWVQRGSLLVKTSPTYGEWFGHAVCLNSNGSKLAVTALGWRDPVYNNEHGAVFVYHQNGDAWVYDGMYYDDTQNGDFGNSICFALDDSYISIGFPGYGVSGSNPPSRRGAVYIQSLTSADLVTLEDQYTAASYARFGEYISLFSVIGGVEILASHRDVGLYSVQNVVAATQIGYFFHKFQFTTETPEV